MDKKFNITTTGETVIIREGKAPEIHEPRRQDWEGVIDAPQRWLEKRIFVERQINIGDSMLLVAREYNMIVLHLNASDDFGGKITGALHISQETQKIGINNGRYLHPIEMAELFKMNRRLFANKSEGMNLISQLKNFKAKVNKEVEDEINMNKGDRRLVMNRTVDSNIPEAFILRLPVFKGQPVQEVEVETYFNPEDLTCTLVSPQLEEIMQTTRDAIIDAEIEAIKQIAPAIVVMEV